MAKKKRKKPSAAPERWPKLRAAIIAFFVLFNVIAAIPTPGSVSKETLARPTNQDELRRWVGLLQGFGIDTDAESLGNWYLDFAASVGRARVIATKPIDGWMSFTQTWQGWRLFGMPDERPYALKIAVRRDGAAEVIYQSGDPERRWSAGLLEYRRVRALYNPSSRGPPATYRGFAQRISERIFEEMPDVDQVTVSVLQSHTTLPGRPPDPEVREKHPLTFARPAR